MELLRPFAENLKARRGDIGLKEHGTVVALQSVCVGSNTNISKSGKTKTRYAHCVLWRKCRCKHLQQLANVLADHAAGENNQLLQIYF